MEIRRIPLADIRENDYNPNEMKPEVFESLVASIRDNGFVQPILVKPEGNGFVIVDGAHRYRALKQLGKSEADCVIVPEGTIAARLFTLSMNALRGRMDNFRVAEIIKDLPDPDIERFLAWDAKQREEIRSLISKIPKLDLPEPETRRNPAFLDFVMSQKDAAVVERALREAGEKSRAKSLLKICRRYLRSAKEGENEK